MEKYGKVTNSMHMYKIVWQGMVQCFMKKVLFSARQGTYRPNIPSISAKNGLRNKFWPLWNGFLTPVREKRCFFSKSPNGTILKFWVLKVLCDVYPNQEKPSVEHFFWPQSIFQLHGMVWKGMVPCRDSYVGKDCLVLGRGASCVVSRHKAW